MVWLGIILLALGLDQITKYMVESNIQNGEMITVIEKFFYLTHSKNTGAAWGILKDGRMFFIPVTIIAVIAMIYFLKNTDKWVLKLSLSMIIGGAMGNLVDRVFRSGGVVDFFEFHFGSYVYPIFNIADMFVVVGTIILGFFILINPDKDRVTEIKNND